MSKLWTALSFHIVIYWSLEYKNANHDPQKVPRSESPFADISAVPRSPRVGKSQSSLSLGQQYLTWVIRCLSLASYLSPSSSHLQKFGNASGFGICKVMPTSVNRGPLASSDIQLELWRNSIYTLFRHAPMLLYISYRETEMLPAFLSGT